MTIAVDIARTTPRSAEAVGIPVPSEGPVPRALGLTRAALTAHGFDGKLGQVLTVPAAAGATVIAVGIGKPSDLTANGLRTAAAALARSASKRTTVATSLADMP